MKLETTKERILEAASKCSTTKEALKELFPEAFEDDKYFDLSKLRGYDGDSDLKIFDNESSMKAGFKDSFFIQIRLSGEYRNKAFYLNDQCNWELKRDLFGSLCLIPTKK